MHLMQSECTDEECLKMECSFLRMWNQFPVLVVLQIGKLKIY